MVGSSSRKTAVAIGGHPRKQLASRGKARQTEIQNKQKVIGSAYVRVYGSDHAFDMAHMYHTSVRYTHVCFDDIFLVVAY